MAMVIRKCRKALFASLLIALCSVNMTLATEDVADKTVTAIGHGTVEGENVSAARQQAINSALAQAVEQSLGVLVSSETLVQNFQVVEDSIHSRAQGFVKEYNVIGESRKRQSYEVTVKALVSMQAIRDQLAAIGLLQQRLGYPRLMVLSVSTESSMGEAAVTAKARIERHFSSMRFDLVNPGPDSGRVYDILPEGGKVDLAKTAAMALAQEAEVLLICVVHAEHTPPTSTRHNSAKTRLTLQALDPATQRVLASATEFAETFGSSRSDAITKSATRAADKAARAASREIVRWWDELDKIGIPYTLLLDNVSDYNQAMEFQDSLRRMALVLGVTERSFGSGVMECEVRYKGKKDQLIRAIMTRADIEDGLRGIRVVESIGNRIVFSR